MHKPSDITIYWLHFVHSILYHAFLDEL